MKQFLMEIVIDERAHSAEAARVMYHLDMALTNGDTKSVDKMLLQAHAWLAQQRERTGGAAVARDTKGAPVVQGDGSRRSDASERSRVTAPSPAPRLTEAEEAAKVIAKAHGQKERAGE